MWLKWTQNLTSPDDKRLFESALRSAKPVLDRVTEILNEREAEITTKELDYNSFGSPSWPYLQAALVGARKEISVLKKLLTLDQKDSNE